MKLIFNNTDFFIIIKLQLTRFAHTIIRMVSVEVQTEEFLTLLQYQDKLTGLYQRIKTILLQKQDLANKVEYLQFKNKALEKSLFEQQTNARQKQTFRNQQLLQDVIVLEEQLAKEKSQLKDFNSNKSTKSRDLYSSRTQEKSSRFEEQRSLNCSLLTITQQPESQPVSPFTFVPKSGKSPQASQVSSSQNSSQQNSIKNLNFKQGKQNNELSLKVIELSKQVQKYKKGSKSTELQLKRLRKLNLQYSNRCKKLEKLVQARSELYANFSEYINENSRTKTSNCPNQGSQSDSVLH